MNSSDLVLDTWTDTTIGDVVAPKVDQGLPSEVNEITYIDIGSIDTKSKRVVSPKYLPISDAPGRARQRIRPDDVLISMTRPNLNAVAKVTPDLDGAIGSTGFCVLRSESVDANWLFYRVQSSDFIEAMVDVVQGALYPAVRPKDILAFPLHLPPCDEQRQMVAEIETQFARLDDAVAALQRARVRLKRYRASVLKAACEGRLVPTEAELARQEGRGYEPASVLLERIKAEREAASGKKGRPRTGHRTDTRSVPTNDLPELPEGWAWTTLDELQIHLTSGSRDWSKFYGHGTGTFILAQNVRPGKLDLTFRQAVDPPANDRDRARSEVQAQDVLITIVGANTGDVCRVPVGLSEHYVCQSVALVRLASPCVAPFVELYLLSQEHGQKQFDNFMYGQGRPHLSFDQLRTTCLALPPVEEQQRIMDEIERVTSLIDQMEATADANLKRAESLRQSILRRAFSRRLVRA